MKRMDPKLLKDVKNQLLAIPPQDKNHVMSPDLTISDFEKEVNQYAAMIVEYNQLLNTAEAKRLSIRDKEKFIRDYRERLRSTVIIIHGKKSDVYKKFIKVARFRKKVVRSKATTKPSVK